MMFWRQYRPQSLSHTLRPALSLALHIGEHLLGEFAGSHEIVAAFSIHHLPFRPRAYYNSEPSTMHLADSEKSACLGCRFHQSIRIPDLEKPARISPPGRSHEVLPGYL